MCAQRTCVFNCIALLSSLTFSQMWCTFLPPSKKTTNKTIDNRINQGPVKDPFASRHGSCDNFGSFFVCLVSHGVKIWNEKQMYHLLNASNQVFALTKFQKWRYIKSCKNQAGKKRRAHFDTQKTNADFYLDFEAFRWCHSLTVCARHSTAIVSVSQTQQVIFDRFFFPSFFLCLSLSMVLSLSWFVWFFVVVCRFHLLSVAHLFPRWIFIYISFLSHHLVVRSKSGDNLHKKIDEKKSTIKDITSSVFICNQPLVNSSFIMLVFVFVVVVVRQLA